MIHLHRAKHPALTDAILRLIVIVTYNVLYARQSHYCLFPKGHTSDQYRNQDTHNFSSSETVPTMSGRCERTIMIHSRRVAAALPSLIFVICTIFALSGCGGQQATGTGSKPYAGTTIRVMLSNHPWADAIKPLLPQFQQQTGIKVNVESYGETQLA